MVFAASVSGQAPARSTIVPDAQACTRCQIVRTLVVTLRDPAGRALIGGTAPVVARDRQGRYFVSDLVRTSVAVFDSSGAFRTSIGRAGSGPGEFRFIQRLFAGPGDSLHIFDQVLSRETVVSPGLQVVRQRALPGRNLPFVRLADGRLVVNHVSGSPELAGLPLHLVDTSGKIVRSFGSDRQVYRAGFEGILRRSLAPGDSGQVYAARNQEYVVEQWDVNAGSKIREYVRRPDWFKPWTVEPPLSRTKAPQPRLYDGLFPSPEGLLWVLVALPDPDYRRAVQPGGPHGYQISDINRYADTMVEVLDLQRGRVVTRRRFDELSPSMFASGLVVTTGFDSSGAPVLRIWRLSVSP
jgi:hypothetical protein